ncbi:MAG: metal ABC transporter substrate-binding protein [Peptococcia bacterium]
MKNLLHNLLSENLGLKCKSLGVSIIILALLFSLASCSTNTKLPASGIGDNDKLTVYTSIYPIYDFCQKIGGDKITVINIVPFGAEPHSFEPSTQTVAKLSKAKLFIYNGAGMEHYLPRLSETLANTEVKLVDTSKEVPLLAATCHHEDQKGDRHEEHHHHGDSDPHIWLSPARASKQGQAIYEALVEIDPDNASYYEANLRQFQQQLEDLDQEFRKALAQCPNKDIIVSHAAFSYLTEDYGLQQISLMGINADAEPGPATLKRTIEYVKENKISYIFWDPMDSPKLLETLSQETGAEILELNSFGSLSEKEIQEGQDYFSLMRTNLKNLQKGLGCSDE